MSPDTTSVPPIGQRARTAVGKTAALLGAFSLLTAACSAPSALPTRAAKPVAVTKLAGGARDDRSARPRPHIWRLTATHHRRPHRAHAPTSPPAAIESPTTLPAPAAGLVPGRITVIGDSVTVDAGPALQALIPGVQLDAEVGEQWETGVGQLQQLRSSGELGSVVVVALGTNGPVSAGEFAQMMAVLQGVSRVVFVTDHAPDYWEEQNNAMFRSEVPQYPNARIADWDAAARANPQWLYSDDTHMPIGGPGAQAWAELVKEQI